MAREAVPALVEALKDGSSGVRTRAALALWQLTGDAGLAVPVLIESLQDRLARLDAAVALGRMGPAARDAVPALVAVLDDDFPLVRTYAALADPLIAFYKDRRSYAAVDGLQPPEHVTTALFAHIERIRGEAATTT